jgi:vacuolar protein sorting-associated protein 13A/C
MEHAQASARCTSVCVFERIWTNRKLDVSHSNAISIWRPVPPAGYVSVGDCLVGGSWNAPRSATVLQKSGGANALVADAVV